MKERPILFSTEMVQAILEGRKTQTRRIVKPQPSILTDGNHFNYKDQHYLSAEELEAFCPYGAPGDVLWVRETWGVTAIGHPEDLRFEYKAGHGPLRAVSDHMVPKKYRSVKLDRWKPSIHMPRSCARIFLLVKDVRVERLKDIRHEDCISEGVRPYDYGNYYHNYLNPKFGGPNPVRHGFLSPKGSFKSLWQSINGQESWNENPWVWVVEFEVR